MYITFWHIKAYVLIKVINYSLVEMLAIGVK